MYPRSYTRSQLADIREFLTAEEVHDRFALQWVIEEAHRELDAGNPETNPIVPWLERKLKERTTMWVNLRPTIEKIQLKVGD